MPLVFCFSPFEFDQYRYGRSSIMINEKFNFNDKFALGFRLFMTPDKDNYRSEFFTEQRKPGIDEVLGGNITAAGICAHESAMKNGESIIVPEF